MASLYSTTDILPARAGARSTTMLTSSRQALAPSRELQGRTHATLRVERRSNRVEELRNSIVSAGGSDVGRAVCDIPILGYPRRRGESRPVDLPGWGHGSNAIEGDFQGEHFQRTTRKLRHKS